MEPLVAAGLLALDVLVLLDEEVEDDDESDDEDEEPDEEDESDPLFVDFDEPGVLLEEALRLSVR